jgi:hypothetical protein
MELLTLNEILLIAAVFVIFFVAMYLKKFVGLKTQFIISIVSFLGLAGVFIHGLITHFSYVKLILTILFTILFAIGLFKRLKALSTRY